MGSDFLKELNISEKDIDKDVTSIFKQYSDDKLSKLYAESIKEFKPNSIIKGKVVSIIKDQVIIDIGYKLNHARWHNFLIFYLDLKQLSLQLPD